MRYYDITVGGVGSTAVTDASTSTTTVTAAASPNVKHWSSLSADGSNNHSAQNIIIDAPVAQFHQPMGNAFVQIQGIDIRTIAQASRYARRPIIIRGGMSSGLPLANKAQQGEILSGMILDSFGNWEGTNMTLSLVIVPIAADDDINLVLDCPMGINLGTAIKNALQIAYPSLTIEVSVSANLVAPHDFMHPCASLSDLATLANEWSIAIMQNTDYAGLSVVKSGNTIYVYDGTVQGDPKSIQFTDLIGQPAWVAYKRMQLVTVMRGDLKLGDLINLAYTSDTSNSSLASYGTISASSGSGQTAYVNRNKSIFSGVWMIIGMRHIGDFRNPDGRAWATVIDAVQTGASS